MKKLPIILGVFALALMMATTCLAATYDGPVLLVEADPGPGVGGDRSVTFTVSFFDPLWTVGEWIGGGFVAFTDGDPSNDGTQVTWPGGTIVDFAVSNGCDTVLRLSQGNHAVTFLEKNIGVPEAPDWVTEWYDDLIILWSDGPTYNLELVTTDGDPDGLAPIPVPSTLLLLGSGLIGFVGLRRKFNKS